MSLNRSGAVSAVYAPVAKRQRPPAFVSLTIQVPILEGGRSVADDKDNRNDEKALPLENRRSQVWAFFEKHPMDPGCAEHLKYWFSLSAPPIPQAPTGRRS